MLFAFAHSTTTNSFSIASHLFLLSRRRRHCLCVFRARLCLVRRSCLHWFFGECSTSENSRTGSRGELSCGNLKAVKENTPRTLSLSTGRRSDSGCICEARLVAHRFFLALFRKQAGLCDTKRKPSCPQGLERWGYREVI